MQRIIKAGVQTIELDDIYKSGAITEMSIIAYVTSSGYRLAVLHGVLLDSRDKTEYGFIYHSDLVRKRIPSSFKFKAKIKTDAIENALKAGREVILFETFTEFLKFSAQRSRL